MAGCLVFALLVVGGSKMPAQVKAAKPGPWEVLFDGKSTEHWRAYRRTAFPDKSWAVENGALKATGVGDRVDLVTKENYDDFELELEWKMSPGGNSGIIYRVTEDPERAWHTGPEIQLLDDEKHKDGKDSKTSTGALYALIAPTNKVLHPVGQWNQMRIIAQGSHVEHWLNGAKIVEYELDSPVLNDLIAKSKFADKPRFAKEKSGHVALQHHGAEVWFRNIRIRRL